MQMGQPEISMQADSVLQSSTLGANCSIVCNKITGKHRIIDTLSANVQQKLQKLIENKEIGLQQQQIVLTELSEWLQTQCRTLKTMEETVTLQHNQIVEKDKIIKSLSEAMQKRIENKINHHVQLEERLVRIEKLTAIIARLQTPAWALSGLKEILKMSNN
jgi:hypothetical protein